MCSSDLSMLSPYDILHVLNSLAVVRYDDVRTDIIAGLLELMQVSGSDSVCVLVGRDCMCVCVSVTVCVCETNSVCVWQREIECVCVAVIMRVSGRDR